MAETDDKPRVLSVWREGTTYFRLVARTDRDWCEVERCVEYKQTVRWEFDGYAPRAAEFYEVAP